MCNHCYHITRRALLLVLPDGHVHQTCCVCAATRVLHGDHAGQNRRVSWRLLPLLLLPLLAGCALTWSATPFASHSIGHGRHGDDVTTFGGSVTFYERGQIPANGVGAPTTLRIDNHVSASSASAASASASASSAASADVDVEHPGRPKHGKH